MSRLDRYILQRIATPFLLAFVVFGFLLVANELRDRSPDLPVAVLRAGDIVRLSIYSMPLMISYIVPVTFLIGTLMAFGALGQKGEIIAIQSAGVSLKRMALPVVLAGAVLAMACFVIQDRLQPVAVSKTYSLLKDELVGRLTLDALDAGVVHEYEDWRVYFRSRDPVTGTFYDLDVVQPDEEGRPEIFHAESAELVTRSSNRVLVLRGGHSIRPDNIRSTWDALELAMPQRVSNRSIKRDLIGKNLGELFEAERVSSKEFQESGTFRLRRRLLKERREIANRLAMPFSTLALGLVGATLGLRAGHGGRGSRMQLFSWGLVIIVLYYVLQIALRPATLTSLEEVLARAWIPNIAVLMVGFILLVRVDRT